MSKENLLSDNELVQRFVGGDQYSLEILIQRDKSRVFSYILLIVKKQQLAEDIFQETFIKVIRSLKRGKYIENGKFVSVDFRHGLSYLTIKRQIQCGIFQRIATDGPIFPSANYRD